MVRANAWEGGQSRAVVGRNDNVISNRGVESWETGPLDARKSLTHVSGCDKLHDRRIPQRVQTRRDIFSCKHGNNHEQGKGKYKRQGRPVTTSQGVRVSSYGRTRRQLMDAFAQSAMTIIPPDHQGCVCRLCKVWIEVLQYDSSVRCIMARDAMHADARGNGVTGGIFGPVRQGHAVYCRSSGNNYRVGANSTPRTARYRTLSTQYCPSTPMPIPPDFFAIGGKIYPLSRWRQMDKPPGQFHDCDIKDKWRPRRGLRAPNQAANMCCWDDGWKSRAAVEIKDQRLIIER